MTSIYRNPGLDAALTSSTAPTGGAGPLKVDARVPPRPAAVIEDISVNGVVIREADIMAEAQNHPADTPGGALRQAAQALVVRQLLLQEARRQGIAAALGPDCKGPVESPEDAAIRILIESEVSVPQANDEECLRYYEAHPGRFRSDWLVEADHILLAAPADDKTARARARQTATALRERLAEQPGEFAEMASAHSDCPSGQQGGNLGQVSPGSTVAEFEKALATIKVGAPAPTVVETRFGIHLVSVNRRTEGMLVPFEAMRERIAGWLDAAAWSKAVSQYIAVLAGAAEITGIEIDSASGGLMQ